MEIPPNSGKLKFNVFFFFLDIINEKYNERRDDFENYKWFLLCFVQTRGTYFQKNERKFFTIF